MKRISNILLIFFIFVTSIVLTSCDKKPTIYEYVESDIVVETGEYKLSGKLTIPESKKIYSGRFASLGNMFGLVLGLLTQAF